MVLNMNKTEFVNAFAATVELSKTESNRLVNAFFDVLMGTLAKGEEVKVVGFGTFKVSEVKGKEVTNPRNKKKMHVPGYKRVRFIAGRVLKDAVKGNNTDK